MDLGCRTVPTAIEPVLRPRNRRAFASVACTAPTLQRVKRHESTSWPPHRAGSLGDRGRRDICAGAVSFESRRHGGFIRHGVVACLGFGRRHVADGLQEPSGIEPIDPFEGRELDRFERAPRSAPMDHFGFVQAVDRLGESVVVRVPDAADRRFNAGVGQTLGVLDRDVLGTPRSEWWTRPPPRTGRRS